MKNSTLRPFNFDVFAHSQMTSKIWLCDTLEQYASDLPEQPIAWILGGWCGLLPMLFFLRTRIHFKKIINFDIDEESSKSSLLLNKKWEIEKRFFAFNKDCNELSFDGGFQGDVPDIVINTSCQSFKNHTWFSKVLPTTKVIVQSTNLQMTGHIFPAFSIDDLKDTFKEGFNIEYQGQLNFSYPDKEFARYMLIGKKL